MKRALRRLVLSLVSVCVIALRCPAAHSAPGVSKGPWVQELSATSALVRVEVDPPAPVTLELWPAAGAPDASRLLRESKEALALHSIRIDGLAPATRYAYTVRANAVSRPGALTTAPRDDSHAPFRVLVYGDNRTDNSAHAAVVRAMAKVPSDFLVNTGDLVNDGSSGSDWQTFFDIEAPLLSERSLVSCVGNHELVGGAAAKYLRYFGPSDGRPAAAVALDPLATTYRWSNARFFLLNGMVSYRAGASRAWLEKALADADSEPGLVWRIVVVHHGPWSSGPHGDNLLFAEASIPQVFQAHHVDLVISGHDHIYERGLAEGLPFLISGGGGAPPYSVKKPSPYSHRHESVRHFVEASVGVGAIDMVATRPDGSTIERCALHKGAGWDCDAPRPKALTDESPRTSPAAPGSRCSCRLPGGDAGVPARSAGFAVALGLGALVLRRRHPAGASSPGVRAILAGMRRSLALAVLGAAAFGNACTTYGDHLERARRAFDQNEHERALALLRDLESDRAKLDPAGQASYEYLRGMTDYRVGYRMDARHWLALAKAHDDSAPGLLSRDWKARASEALDELNAVVESEGLAGLASSRKPGEDDRTRLDAAIDER